MMLKALAAMLAFMGGPHVYQEWLDFIEEPPMARAINRNLDKIPLPTAAGTSFMKVWTKGSSQSLTNSARWHGQAQKWPVKFTGSLLSLVSNQAVGQYYLEAASPNEDPTTPYYNTVARTLDDGWGGGSSANDIGDHFQRGKEWPFVGNTPSFHELFRLSRHTGGFTTATDIDARKNYRLLVRDGADTIARFRVQTFSVSSLGDEDDYGHPTWDAGVGPALDQSSYDGIKAFDIEVPSSASLGSAGNNTRGIVVKQSNQATSGKVLEVLGCLEWDSASGTDFPSTGLMWLSTADSGSSFWDHANTVSDEADEAMVAALGGADLMIWEGGHNSEDNGNENFKANLQAAIAKANLAHTSQGLPAPKHLLVAVWASSSGSMDDDKAEAMDALAAANGYGFISLWDSYGRVSPQGLTNRLDGTAVSGNYSLDPLHPSNSQTAEAFAMDIWWHFQEANWVPPANGSGIRSTKLRDFQVR